MGQWLAVNVASFGVGPPIFPPNPAGRGIGWGTCAGAIAPLSGRPLSTPRWRPRLVNLRLLEKGHTVCYPSESRRTREHEKPAGRTWAAFGSPQDPTEHTRSPGRNGTPRAFEKARAENRPILLSISAVWCHWCHVMDETSYSDPQVIGLINERFVPVRVDNDHRPDVNSRYNMGGWPTTAFPDPRGRRHRRWDLYGPG